MHPYLRIKHSTANWSIYGTCEGVGLDSGLSYVDLATTHTIQALPCPFDPT